MKNSIRYEDTLIPHTGILMTATQSGMTSIDAVSEFVDNSFGPAAGNTDKIHMVETEDAVIFWDAGAGVRDINQLFRLGDGSSRNSAEDIGKFGVGSKFGALTFGTKVTVMTVHDGTFHKFSVDWGKVLQTGEWPRSYRGKGEPLSKAPKTIRNGGTVIVIQDLHPAKRRLRDATYVKALGLRFMPAFDSGKDIILSRAKTLSSALESTKPGISIAAEFEKLIKTAIRGKLTTTLSVNGMTANCLFGELRDGDRNLSGIHITYSGRVVTTIHGKLNGVQIPARLFGRIDLSSDWKNHLNYNKTVITHDTEELEEAIAEAGKPVIDKLTEAEQNDAFERLGAELSNMIDPNFGRILKSEKGDWDLSEEGEDVIHLEPGGQTDEPVDPDNPNPTITTKAKAEPGDKRSRKGSFRIKLEPEHGGKNGNVSSASLSDDGEIVTCVVKLNKDYKIVNTALVGHPINRPATMFLAVHALAQYMVENKEWIERMFSREMSDAIDALHENEKPEAVYTAIMGMVISND